jgi:Lipocalin-like domain
MRNIISGIVMSLFVMFTLTGCETDNKTLLTDGVWTFQNMTTDSEDETIVALLTLGKALLTDATLEFQEGGSYIITSPLVDDPSTGDWSLVAEQIIMTPDGDEPPSTSNIETLTKDKLSYVETLLDGDLNSYKVTTTWTR